MNRSILIPRQFLSMMLIGVAFAASAQNTTRPSLKLKEPIQSAVSRDNTAKADTLRDCSGVLEFRGYDKPQTSMTESMFVTNLSDQEIDGFNFTITYYDMQGRQVHTRTETVKEAIGANQTVNINIKAWDKQRQWHYCRSRSKHRRSTPFDLKVHVNYVIY